MLIVGFDIGIHDMNVSASVFAYSPTYERWALFKIISFFLSFMGFNADNWNLILLLMIGMFWYQIMLVSTSTKEGSVQNFFFLSLSCGSS